ncbi:MAG TPA: hypothetical protein VKV73_30170, partial [Chloroflexota bacterium]|nr:hypothetical protein [Chloroflexota bacterium]
MQAATDLELLRIEIETLWPPDARGRIRGPDLVIASAADGVAAAIGTAVADEVATALMTAVASAAPVRDPGMPPTMLEGCRQLLEARLGAVALAPMSGPSYFIPETVV